MTKEPANHVSENNFRAIYEQRHCNFYRNFHFHQNLITYEYSFKERSILKNLYCKQTTRRRVNDIFWGNCNKGIPSSNEIRNAEWLSYAA
jgi:hypothetical protein